VLRIEHTLLCGYSYALKAGYKPPTFKKLEELLLPEEIDPNYYINGFEIDNKKMIEQIIDSYGKLGFLFFSRDRIEEMTGSDICNPIMLYYDVYNFIYDCKAFLDSISVILNDFYHIDKKNGKIDLKWPLFRCEVVKKQPKFTQTISEYEGWINEVVFWREALIHKYSTPLTCPRGLRMLIEQWNELDKKKSPDLMILSEPVPFLSVNFPDLIDRHGNAFQTIEKFYHTWIENACDMYQKICAIIADDLARARARTHSSA